MSSTPEAAAAASPESTSSAGTNPSLQVSLETGELTRFLRILTPKMAQGAVFDAIDLQVQSDDREAFLVSEHTDKMATYFQSFWFSLVPGNIPQNGEIDVEETDRLLLCLDSGLFGETVSIRAAGNRLKLSGGGADMQVGLVPATRVPRSTAENGYGKGPNSVNVRTSPKRRPAPGAPWADWVKAGYAVEHLTTDHIQKILAAGRLMAERHDKAVLIRFTQKDGVLFIRAEPTGARAAAVADPVTVELGRLGEPDSPDFNLATQFNGLDALLGVLRHTKATETILLYHPEEKTGNLLTSEFAEKGTIATMGLCQTFSGWAGSPPATDKKPAKK